MAIVKMDHVRLIAMTEDREEILRRLQRLGCVEIDQAVLPDDQPQSGQAPPEETDSLARLREQLSRPDAQRLNAAREEQNQADHALYVLKKYAPAKEKFLVPKPSLDEADLFDQAAADQTRQSAQEINGAFRRVNTIHAEHQAVRPKGPAGALADHGPAPGYPVHRPGYGADGHPAPGGRLRCRPGGGPGCR